MYIHIYDSVCELFPNIIPSIFIFHLCRAFFEDFDGIEFDWE